MTTWTNDSNSRQPWGLFHKSSLNHNAVNDQGHDNLFQLLQVDIELTTLYFDYIAIVKSA